MRIPHFLGTSRRLLVVAFTLVACLSVVFATTISAQGPDGSQDTAADQQSSGAPLPPPDAEAIAEALAAGPEDVLYDNGPLVNEPGGAPGGADGSVLQTTLGMNTLGFGHAVTSGFRVADDFTVDDPGGWQVDQITFYAYQTGSSTTSTITAVNYRIWDGVPGAAGSTVVFGDTTTNLLIDTTWSGIYRYSETTTDTTRPIMANTASAGFSLDAGTYWLDWQVGGSLTSGPWAPPITIDGQTTTGNGLQYNPTTATWGDADDSGTLTQQGFPFIIEGTVAGGPTPTATGGATSIQLGTLESDGGSNPWLVLSLVGIAGLAGAAWVGARRSR